MVSDLWTPVCAVCSVCSVFSVLSVFCVLSVLSFSPCAADPHIQPCCSLCACVTAPGSTSLRCENIKLIADSHGDFAHPFQSLGNNCGSVCAALCNRGAEAACCCRDVQCERKTHSLRKTHSVRKTHSLRKTHSVRKTPRSHQESL